MRICKFPLTVQGLSEHYGWTPVREAIGELIEVGLIRKKSNGRLEAITPKRRSKKSNFQTQQESQKKPVENITTNWWKSVLGGKSVLFAKKQLPTSMTLPALPWQPQRLAGEGLLEHVPRRGWRVKPFRQEDLQAFLQVREVMELKALELARTKLTSLEAKKKLRQIKASNKLAKMEKSVSIDNSLHKFIIGLAGNPFIDDFFQRHGNIIPFCLNGRAMIKRHPGSQTTSQDHRGSAQRRLGTSRKRSCLLIFTPTTRCCRKSLLNMKFLVPILLLSLGIHLFGTPDYLKMSNAGLPLF